MNELWQLRVTDSKGFVYEAADLTGTAEIGRQQNRDEKHPAHFQSNGIWRIVIAPLEEITVGRRHLEVKPLPNGHFLLTNKNDKQTVGLGNSNLAPATSCEVALPVKIRLGNKTVLLQRPDTEEVLESLPLATPAPGIPSLFSSMQVTISRAQAPDMKADQLMAWIQAFLGLLHSAAGSADFYVKAARALIDLVKMDSGRVLLRVGEQWQEIALQRAPSLRNEPDWRPSSRVLASVLRDKKTSWQIPDMRGSMSTRGLDAVVAAPILDRHGAVIGALYGERSLTDNPGQRPISLVEAMLVEVLASGVAAGLARQEQEQAALRARLQMEQFFTPRLAASLVDHPELLQGRATAISALFCDIRGFSRISERLGPVQTVEWISDVMGELTQCVLDHEGVVVDYIGDEMMAIWGAPENQPDHGPRACRTALTMLERLPRMNERWQTILQEPLSLGIGINSGMAQVGNVGSKVKFKYGALGNTVNLASRVQGATKYLKTGLLITDATKTLLDEQFITRRLCQVRVVNIREPVTLFELAPSADDSWLGLKLGYEQALEEFNQGEFRQACRIVGRLIADHPNDGPALLLLSRAVACLVEEPERFDPVMVLPGK